MKRVLHISAYRRLLLAYGLNELAWSVGTLALAFLVYRRTGSAIGATTFFLCSQVGPALVSPMFVSRVDQRSPRAVLSVLYALEGALFGVLALLTQNFNLIAVLVLVVLDGSVAIVARSLARAATVEILRPVDLLPEGNALTNVVFSVCYMIGPAIGGVVVASGGTVAAMVVNCGLFLAIAVVLITAGSLPRGAAEPEPTKRRVRGAIEHVMGAPALRWMLILQSGGLIAFTMSVPVEVVLASHTLHAGASGYGALMSGWGAGAVLGSAVYARWRRKPALVLMIGSALSMTVGFALMGLAPTIVVAVIGAALGGIGNGGGLMAAKTMLQDYTPQRWMAMVTSLNESISQVTPGIGILLGGVLTAIVSPRLALLVAAVGSFIYAGVAGLVLRRSRIGDPPPHTEAESAKANGVHPERKGAKVPIAMESRETLV
jgi:MFS family permease